MAKSRARYLAELLNTSGLVRRSRSALAGEDETIDLDALPTITNAKLENSSVSIAGHTLSLGGSLSLNTADIGEHASYLYYTDARARAALSVSGSLSYNSTTGVLSYTTPTTIASLSNHDTDSLSEGSTNLYYTSARANTDFDTRLATKSTTDLSEGTNLYYTSARFDTAFSGKSTTNLSEGTNLYYTSARFDTAFSGKSTTDLSEGTNLYFTNARARSALSVSGSLSYDSGTGVISYTTPSTIASLSNHTTDGLTEGSTNLYYTSARANTDFDTRLATKSTTNLSEGTNLYYTDARVGSYLTANSYATQTYVSTAISNLVDAAPSTLDTLNELAAALGDDANFSTTVTNSIATKWTQDNTKISNWDTAYGWGNHASAGYLASSSYTAADVLTKIKTVDGSGSGLDADLLDGLQASQFLRSDANDSTSGALTVAGNFTANRFITRDLGGSGIGNSYDERVVLLIPIIETNTSHTNIINGKLSALKTGGNVCDVFDVFAHSVYNDTRASFFSQGQRTGHKFVSCTYDGIKWLAIKFSYTANPYNYFTFHGVADTNVSGASDHILKVISYYDNNGGGVLNSEINNSIADYTPNGVAYKGVADSYQFDNGVGTTTYMLLGNTAFSYKGNNIWHAGNDGSGSGLDADTLDGVQATGFLYRDVTDSGTNINLTTDAGSGSAAGLYVENSANAFRFQLYGDGVNYGFLDGKWAAWDLKKQIGGNLTVDHGGTLYTVWDAYNDGSGSGLDADLLDGQHGSYYQPASTAITTSNIGSQSVASAAAIDGIGFRNGNSTNGTSPDNIPENGTNYVNSISLYGQTDGALYSQAYSTSWVHQIYGDYRTGNIAVRGRNNGTWQSWKTIWSSDNDGAGSGLDADLLDGYSPGNTVNTIAYWSSTGNLWVNNPENYSGEVRLGAAWDKGGVYASNTLSLGTSSSTIQTVFSNSVKHTFGSDGRLAATYYDYGNSSYNFAAGDWGFRHNTPYGWIQFGPANGSYAHIYTDRGNFYFNVDTLYANGNLMWTSANDGSGSGLDADTCDGQHLGTSANVTFNQVYANDWFRTYGEEGLYSQSYGQHFYPDSGGQYWDMDGPLRVRDGYEGTIKGHYGYWDGGGTGVLDAGSWWLNNGGTNNGTVLCIGGYSSANAHSSNTGRKLLFGGADSDAQGNYYIGTNLENVGGNHNKLDLRWHTGIRMGAQTQYGGIRIFDSEDMGTLRWQFNGTSGYNFQYTWTHLSGFHGVYSSNNSFHLYPNNITYGSCRIDGTRGGWYGIHFGSNMTLMMNNTECGFHREADGWYLYVSSKSLYVPGNITAYWSDRRLKKNIQPLGEGVGLETINALQPSSFAWNEKAEQVNENLFDGKEEVSLIAQEVQEILPDAVCENKSAGKDKEYLTINYDKITPYLIQAVKDLTKKVQELEEKLNGIA